MKTTATKSTKTAKRSSRKAKSWKSGNRLRNVRTADEKGRISLGRRFANKTVSIEPGSDKSELILTLSEVVPTRELWLFRNPEALAAVRRGLHESRDDKKFPAPLDLDADADFVDQLEE